MQNLCQSLLKSPEQKMNKIFFFPDSRKKSIGDRRIFTRKSKNQTNSIHTDLAQRRESSQRKFHIKSGFNFKSKYENTTLATQLSNTNNSEKLIFKKRAFSEQKIPKSKNYSQFEHNNPKTEIKINFAKKIIQDLKLQTFKNRKSFSSYFQNSSKNISKSSQLKQKNKIIRQKLLRNSMEKLKPSFNINEAKFFSSKKTLRKLASQTDFQIKREYFQKSRNSNITAEDNFMTKSNNQEKAEDKIYKNALKKASQPLSCYSSYLKSKNQQISYEIKLQFLNQFMKIPKDNGVEDHIDFAALNLIESVYVCLIGIISDNCQESEKSRKRSNHEILKQYIGLYFQTYSKMKIEFILCEVLFKTVKKKLLQYFTMQRLVFYWISEMCKKHELESNPQNLKKIRRFLKISEEILVAITNMLYDNPNPTKSKKDTFNETFTSLRLTRQIEKRLPELKETILMIKQIITQTKHKDPVFNFFMGLLGLLNSVQKQENFDMKKMFTLEQYYNWTNLQIPPLFYLPTTPSKPYTMVIDLDGSLTFYNEQTKILKYRPYMDRFLIAMQKYFQIIIFSSYPKERTDIIVQEIERDDNIFSYRLYKSHMVFQEGMLRKNIGYIGRSLHKLIFIDDEEKNADWLPLNGYLIKSFTGNKQDKQLLYLTDWLTNLMETEPGDIRGKLKKTQSALESIEETNEVSSTIQPSISYENER